jgi:hypothetical protein
MRRKGIFRTLQQIKLKPLVSLPGKRRRQSKLSFPPEFAQKLKWFGPDDEEEIDYSHSHRDESHLLAENAYGRTLLQNTAVWSGSLLFLKLTLLGR